MDAVDVSFDEEGPLNDSWSFYFHDPKDSNWTLESYRRIGDASTLADVLAMSTTLSDFLCHGMFFVMREHVFPCWDDKHNIDGGCISLKVNAENTHAVWDEIVKRVVGETSHSTDSSIVNGVSISPKRGVCIIKVWLGSAAAAATGAAPHSGVRVPTRYRGDVVYRSNRDNIQIDATKVAGAAVK